ncbi:MAG: N-acetylneuraminate synthase family protein [Nitrososphaera sp.]|nr:N-acetylneuraminate synthase family protein [Nitrososphaera sp.]
MIIAERCIGRHVSPYFIAEACNNHGSNIRIAVEMIDVAKKIGVDAIKFQLRLGEFYLSLTDYSRLFDHAAKVGQTCFFTVYEQKTLEFIHVINPPAIKIGSAEWIDFGFVRHVLSLNKPTIISTGGGTQDQISELSEILENHANVAVLHCVSVYSCPPHLANLRLIEDYQEDFDCVGFSDHTIGNHLTVAAVMLGACIVEKHFTLDKGIGGPDQEFSLLPWEFSSMMKNCREAWEASRDVEKEYLEEEKAKLSKWRN